MADLAHFISFGLSLQARKDVSEKVKKGLVWNQTLHPKRQLQSNSTSKHWSLSISCYIKISIRFCSMTILGRKSADLVGMRIFVVSWVLPWQDRLFFSWSKAHLRAPDLADRWRQSSGAEPLLFREQERLCHQEQSLQVPCPAVAVHWLHCSVLFFLIISIYFWKSYKKACTTLFFNPYELVAASCSEKWGFEPFVTAVGDNMCYRPSCEHFWASPLAEQSPGKRQGLTEHNFEGLIPKATSR